MKNIVLIAGLLLLAVGANATPLNCKIEPSIMPSTTIDVVAYPGATRAGQLGGIMSQLSIRNNNLLEIQVFEGGREIAKATGSVAVSQTASGVTSSGAQVSATCSPLN